jgi:deoxyadenosine/deoxycytidine kinase
MSPVLIGVVGNTGSGKSLAADALAKGLGFRHFPERVDDNAFFARFMAEPQDWAFRSQMAFMLGAVRDAAEARTSARGAVIERPVEEMHGIFVVDQLRNGVLCADEAALLESVVGLGKKLGGAPDLLVALTAPTPTLFQRIRSRGRGGEENLTLDYLDRLDRRYREWLASWQGPMVRMDTTAADLGDAAEASELVHQVEGVLPSLR